MTEDPTLHDEALDWIIRQRDPAFDAWPEFAAWLGADPARAEVYQAMADADRDLPAMLPAAPRPQAVPARRVGRRAWLGGAVAASLVAAGSYSFLSLRPEPYEVATAAGQTRLLVLVDGTRIDMNGATRLRLDRNDERFVELVDGEAVFTVVHNEARPFEMRVGGATLLDVGTVFNVKRHKGATDVAVAEGEVIFNPQTENIRLPGGRWLRTVDKETRLVIGEIEPGVIGAWRTGRLVYPGTPLELVAQDLSRNLGMTIEAAPAVAGRRFRGVISFGRDRQGAVARLGPLLGVQVRGAGDRWLLTDEDG
ncbi:FecR family protein [Glacieibacterium frigidum]|uniref:Iron dicitrate transport regulator FecR n=1 Tax=Glacieibacterium frigidum TaxID=2593303 RepID=A0A552UG81_9SPHN|nr:FecR domain-containing protein [Glacieibacterium frigidum]TRW17225.1 iron dicitrate transport regulator FecR [Glacieibacterium frigidum]